MTNLTLTREDRAAGLILLHYTRDLIDRAWTQHALARDVYGEKVNPSSSRAVCWCMEGALCAAAGLDSPSDIDSELTRAAWVAEWALEQAIGPAETVTECNDNAFAVREVLDVVELAWAWLSEETQA